MRRCLTLEGCVMELRAPTLHQTHRPTPESDLDPPHGQHTWSSVESMRSGYELESLADSAAPQLVGGVVDHSGIPDQHLGPMLDLPPTDRWRPPPDCPDRWDNSGIRSPTFPGSCSGRPPTSVELRHSAATTPESGTLPLDVGP